MFCYTIRYSFMDGQKSDTTVAEAETRDHCCAKHESRPVGEVQSVRRTAFATAQERTRVRGSLARVSGAKTLLALACLSAPLFAAEPSTESRTIRVHKQDIVSIATQFRYTTLVELQKGEEITDATCGDKTFWAINTSGNFVFIKPLGEKAGEHTNINIITAAGNVYTLLVREVSKDPNAHADLKIFLEPVEEDALIAIAHPQYVKASALDDLKRQLEAQSKELAQTKQSAEFLEAKKLRHDYEWKVGKESETFGVRAIYEDGRFTYIETSSQEAPALYELDGKKERLIQYTLENGLYVVPKVLDHGCLRVGKSRLEFTRNKETV